MSEEAKDPTLSKEERKANRRERLNVGKFGNAGLGDSQAGQVVAEVSVDSKLSLKTLENAKSLVKFEAQVLDSITQFRLLAEETERKRRSDFNEKYKERINLLDEEAMKASDLNSEIDQKWSEMMNYEIPQELQHEMNEQLKLCEGVIREKEVLIQDFRTSLRHQDDEYVKSLKKQHDEISQLVIKTNEACLVMKNQYEVKLSSIENYCNEERTQLIDTHTNEMEKMLLEREQKEKYYLDEKQSREEKNKSEMDILIAKGIDDYNKLKIELESNIQTLNQQLEEIKATYQLNAEKLEYNYRVLTELNSEKIIEKEKLKRKITKIKDQLNNVMSKYEEIEKSYSKTCNQLTDDYRELTKRYKDLQIKFKHFEIADTVKYKQIRQMHQDELKDVLTEILRMDQIIATKYLGNTWNMMDLTWIDTYEDSQLSMIENRDMLSSTSTTSLVIPAVMKKKDVSNRLGNINEEDPENDEREGEEGEGESESVENRIITTTTGSSTSTSAAAVVVTTAGGSVSVSGADVVVVLSDEEIKQSRLDIMTKYWKNVENIISDEQMQIWKQLIKDSMNLKVLLDKRNKSISRIESLKNENIQLKIQLNKCLGDDDYNSKFQVPPVMTLHVPSILPPPSSISSSSSSQKKNTSFKSDGRTMNGDMSLSPSTELKYKKLSLKSNSLVLSTPSSQIDTLPPLPTTKKSLRR